MHVEGPTSGGGLPFDPAAQSSECSESKHRTRRSQRRESHGADAQQLPTQRAAEEDVPKQKEKESGDKLAECLCVQ